MYSVYYCQMSALECRVSGILFFFGVIIYKHIWLETFYVWIISSKSCFHHIVFFLCQHFSLSLFFLFSTPTALHTLTVYSTVFLCPPSQMWVPVIPHRNRMKNNEYETVELVDSDLTLMLENAKRYNVPHSTIYKRALKLQHIQQVGSQWGASRRLSHQLTINHAHWKTAVPCSLFRWRERSFCRGTTTTETAWCPRLRPTPTA